jgi:2-dehydropantoate 2-reductase
LLAKHGLRIRSKLGDFHTATPPLVAADGLAEPFDLVLLSCKAYDLEGAMASFAGAVGPNTAILPMLNGMRHLEILAEHFGAERVLGGQCVISATLDAEGAIVHLNDLHSMTFGELDGARSPRIEAIASALTGAGFDARLSELIRLEMWEKWTFIATGAGITCLMRSTVGDIVTAGATDLAMGLFTECAAIATAQGFPPRQALLERSKAALTTPGSPLAASMLRDIEGGMPVEADHVLGDLLRRAAGIAERSLLRIAYLNLKTYEARRERLEKAKS